MKVTGTTSAWAQRREAVRAIVTHPMMDRSVAVLIILSVAVLFLELREPENEFYATIGWTINILFLAELSIRFVAERSKLRFFGSYWIDIISVLHLVFPGVPALRALRLLRLFRLGPLMLQSNRRLASIVRQTVGEQLTILTIIVVAVMLVTLGFTAIEPELEDVETAFWSALLSLIAGEPIGFEPTTLPGRILTLIIMLGGLTVFALLTGTVSAVMGDKLRKGWTNNRMRLEDLEGHVIICGWNRSAPVMLAEMESTQSRRQHPVLVIAEKRPDFSPELDGDPDFYFLEGDYTKVETMERAGLRRASSAILLADRTNPLRTDQDRDARTVLAALTIEKLNAGIFTCAELLSRENEPHLRLAGIEEVVVGDDYSATILAASSRVRGVTDIADEIFSSQFGNQIYKLDIPTQWESRTVLDIQRELKEKHDALLLAIERPKDAEAPEGDPATPRTLTNPPHDYKLLKGYQLILLARKEPEW